MSELVDNGGIPEGDLPENRPLKPKTSKKINIWLPLWIAFGIALGIVIGNIFSIFNSRHSLFNRGNKIEAVLEYIYESYVDPVDIQELVEESINNTVAGLDPHSVYISAKDMELMGDDLEGHFSGIGVQFILRKDTIVIVSVIPGGPSEISGIQAGDRIVYVNDSIYTNKEITNEKVMRGLRGPKGSTVKLGLKRLSVEKIIDIKVMRADIPVSSIDASFSLENKTGYIKISKFAFNTYPDFISSISKLKSEGCESFIVDLRQNSGGSLSAAIQMVNEFLGSGQLIVYTEGRSFPREDVFADGTGTCQKGQLVVLIDEGSASASEVFSGAIQDLDRGLIIGRRSYGKGLVQNQRQFRDGSALRLTIARYYTPSGRSIQKAYEKGHLDDYNQDLMRRYLRGEFDSQDSIKQDENPLFHTLAGRPVHGGGGIMPDIFIPRDTVGINAYYTKVAGYLYEYAFDFTDQNRNKLSTFKDWNKLHNYLKQQPLVANLVTYAEERDVRRRPYLIEESRSLMENQMYGYIIRNILGDEGYYRVILKDDIVLKKAIESINTKKALPENVASKLYQK